MRITAAAFGFIAFAAIAAAVPALAQDLQFDLINASSFDLDQLYVAPADTDSWGEDILGREVLASGDDGEVTIADGEAVCAYDMRFVMQDGQTIEGTADLCENDSFTLHDN